MSHRTPRSKSWRSVPRGHWIERAAWGSRDWRPVNRGTWTSSGIGPTSRCGGMSSSSRSMRFNLFHIHQASARTDGMGVPAKGLTGHGYEGHYFWDTEIYVLPFLIYTSPQVARNLLRFRYRMLDAARAAHARSTSRERSSPGGPSTGRKPRPTTRPARPNTTSTRTSSMP